MSELTLERGQISAPCAKEQQELIDAAASLTGATINQFVLQAALEKANWVIEGEPGITLNEADAAMILEMLENPSRPNAALTKAFERYQTRVENGTLYNRIASKP
jgi:uncharacterized protein (DUF1778 family)